MSGLRKLGVVIMLNKTPQRKKPWEWKSHYKTELPAFEAGSVSMIAKATDKL